MKAAKKDISILSSFLLFSVINFICRIAVKYLVGRLSVKYGIEVGIYFILSFLSGGCGQKTFPSMRFLARGGQVEEGVTVEKFNSAYYWKPVEDTNFTVGIVVKIGDKDETLGRQTIPPGT